MDKPLDGKPLAPLGMTLDTLERAMQWLAEQGWYLWYEDGTDDTPAGWNFAQSNRRNASVTGRKPTISEAVEHKLLTMMSERDAQHAQTTAHANKLAREKKEIEEVLGRGRP